MRRKRRWFILSRTFSWCAWVGLIAILGWQSWELWNRWQERGVFVSRLESRRSQLAQLRDARVRQKAELDKISHELGALGPITRPEFAQDSALSAWLSRVERLKSILAQNARWNIPELRYLAWNDWLSVTLENPMSTNAEIREA